MIPRRAGRFLPELDKENLRKKILDGATLAFRSGPLDLAGIAMVAISIDVLSGVCVYSHYGARQELYENGLRFSSLPNRLRCPTALNLQLAAFTVLR